MKTKNWQNGALVFLLSVYFDDNYTDNIEWALWNYCAFSEGTQVQWLDFHQVKPAVIYERPIGTLDKIATPLYEMTFMPKDERAKTVYYGYSLELDRLYLHVAVKEQGA